MLVTWVYELLNINIGLLNVLASVPSVCTLVCRCICIHSLHSLYTTCIWGLYYQLVLKKGCHLLLCTGVLCCSPWCVVEASFLLLSYRGSQNGRSSLTRICPPSLNDTSTMTKSLDPSGARGWDTDGVVFSRVYCRLHLGHAWMRLSSTMKSLFRTAFHECIWLQNGQTIELCNGLKVAGQYNGLGLWLPAKRFWVWSPNVFNPNASL